jgi:hypothetical protein
MDQFIVPLLVVIFYIGKVVLKKMSEKSGDEVAAPKPPPMRQTTQAPVRGGTGERKMGEQEEKMRKFFEALGLPTDSLPPAPVVPKGQPPPMAAPPPLARKPRAERKPDPVVARPSFMPDAPSSVSVVGSLAGPQMASPAQMYAATHISAPALRPVSQQDLSPAAAIALELRRTPLALRRAVVINELLGKPLAMR